MGLYPSLLRFQICSLISVSDGFYLARLMTQSCGNSQSKHKLGSDGLYAQVWSPHIVDKFEHLQSNLEFVLSFHELGFIHWVLFFLYRTNDVNSEALLTVSESSGYLQAVCTYAHRPEIEIMLSFLLLNLEFNSVGLFYLFETGKSPRPPHLNVCFCFWTVVFHCVIFPRLSWLPCLSHGQQPVI